MPSKDQPIDLLIPLNEAKRGFWSSILSIEEMEERILRSMMTGNGEDI
jgi:hypothetical protein